LARNDRDAAAREKKMPELTEPVVVYIGLGSNLGDSIGTLKAANRALVALSATGTLRCASLYQSAPVDTRVQPDFINSVSMLVTSLTADDLLQCLMDIEQKFRRQRSGEAGEPRTLDLDLLLYGQLLINTDQLSVPHPRMHERAFVLYPLSEIAPELIVPGHGRVSDLMKQCQHQRLERLGDASHEPE